MLIKIKSVIKSSVIKSFVPVIISVFAVGAIVFAWTEPNQTPPSGNVDAPLNTGAIGQSKKGNLALNTDGTLAYGLLVPFGSVGIGTVTPAAKLDVQGDVEAKSFANRMKRVSASDTNQYYTYGTSWETIRTFTIPMTEGWTAKMLNFKALLMFSGNGSGTLRLLVDNSEGGLGGDILTYGNSDSWNPIGINLGETGVRALIGKNDIVIAVQMKNSSDRVRTLVKNQVLEIVYVPSVFSQQLINDNNTYYATQGAAWQTVKQFSFPVTGDRIVKKIILNAALSAGTIYPNIASAGLRMISGLDNFSQLGFDAAVSTYGSYITKKIGIISFGENSLRLGSSGDIVVLVQIRGDNVNSAAYVKNISLSVLYNDGLTNILE